MHHMQIARNKLSSQAMSSMRPALLRIIVSHSYTPYSILDSPIYFQAQGAKSQEANESLVTTSISSLISAATLFIAPHVAGATHLATGP